MSRLKVYTLLALILTTAFCGIIGMGYLYYYEEAQHESLVGSLKQQVYTLNVKLAEAKEENDKLRAQLQLNDGEETPEQNADAIGSEPTLFENSGVVDLTTLMEKMMLNRDATTEGGTNAKPSMEGILDMAKQFTESPFFGNMMVTQQYDGLFKRLNLSPKRQEALMAILMESSQTSMASVFGMIDVKSREDYEAKEKEIKEREKQLRGKVAGVLSKDEMAIYDDYESNKGEYIQRDSMLSEMGYMSEKVSEQSMNRFVDVFLENETAFQNSGEQIMPPDPAALFDSGAFLPGDILGQRADVMQQSLEQISEELTPEEFDALARYIEMQRMQAAQMQTMMESMGMDESFQEFIQEMGLPIGESAEKK